MLKSARPWPIAVFVTAFAYAFWAWFAISIIILIARRAGGLASGRKDRAARKVGRKTLLTAPIAPPLVTPLNAPEQSQPLALPAGPPPAPAAPPSTSAAPQLAGPAAAPPIPARPAEPNPIVAAQLPSAAARSGIFAPLSTPVAAAGERSDAVLTVAQMMQGVELPGDLIPFTGVDLSDPRFASGQRAVFLTTTPAMVVGPALADELERVGMTVRSLDDVTALATRGADEMQLRLRSIGPPINGKGDPLYPTAPPDSVIVEVEINATTD